MTEVIRLAHQRGIWVLSDECYVYLNYSGKNFSVGSLREYKERFVVLGSLSKTYAMFEELSDFANLPLLALVSVVLSLLLMPALNAYSRYNERQADRYAFESIASIDPFVSSMNKLAEQNLAERTPAKWVEWFFHSHPAISRRVTAARNFQSQKI